MKTKAVKRSVKLLVDGGEETIVFMTYTEQFYNLANNIRRKGLSLRNLAELSHIEFERLKNFFNGDILLMSPSEQADISKAIASV